MSFAHLQNSPCISESVVSFIPGMSGSVIVVGPGNKTKQFVLYLYRLTNANNPFTIDW